MHSVYVSAVALLHASMYCRFFEDGSCVIRCQERRYVQGKQCLPCHNTCKACTAEGPDSCTSCDTGKHSHRDKYIQIVLFFFFSCGENRKIFAGAKVKYFLFFIISASWMCVNLTGLYRHRSVFTVGNEWFMFPKLQIPTLMFCVTAVAENRNISY